MSRLLLAAFALAPLCSLAASSDEETYDFRKSKDLSAVEVSSENDYYGFNNKDRYYTNGFKVAYVTPSLSGDPAVWNYRLHMGVSQEIYTPSNQGASTPPFGDLPYSAWLYAFVGIGWEDDSSLDLLTLRAGIVGPSALGKQVQNNYHNFAGDSTAKGWDTQLRDEPGIDIEWHRIWRSRLAGTRDGFSAEILPRIGIEMGTVRTYGSTGFQFRYGKSLPTDFGVRLSRDTIVDGVPVKFEGGKGIAPDAYYVFGDASGEAYFWNMNIEGNMYHSGNGVPKNDFVGQLAFGFAIHWGSTKLAFTEAFRTMEFDNQKGGPFSSFGNVSLSVGF